MTRMDADRKKEGQEDWGQENRVMAGDDKTDFSHNQKNE